MRHRQNAGRGFSWAACGAAISVLLAAAVLAAVGLGGSAGPWTGFLLAAAAGLLGVGLAAAGRRVADRQAKEFARRRRADLARVAVAEHRLRAETERLRAGLDHEQQYSALLRDQLQQSRRRILELQLRLPVPGVGPAAGPRGPLSAPEAASLAWITGLGEAADLDARDAAELSDGPTFVDGLTSIGGLTLVDGLPFVDGLTLVDGLPFLDGLPFVDGSDLAGPAARPGSPTAGPSRGGHEAGAGFGSSVAETSLPSGGRRRAPKQTNPAADHSYEGSGEARPRGTRRRPADRDPAREGLTSVPGTGPDPAELPGRVYRPFIEPRFAPGPVSRSALEMAPVIDHPGAGEAFLDLTAYDETLEFQRPQARRREA